MTAEKAVGLHEGNERTMGQCVVDRRCAWLAAEAPREPWCCHRRASPSYLSEEVYVPGLIRMLSCAPHPFAFRA